MKGFRAPKYSCSICNKQFKSKIKHYNHVMNSRCSSKNKIFENVTGLETQKHVLQQYFGRDYNFNNIPTGNRHLRTGIPLPRLSSYRNAAI